METQAQYLQKETYIAQEKTDVKVQASGSRMLFVDNLRIFLTILVILHHTMNIYAGSGSWMYLEGRQDMLTAILGKWFTVINQSYFMGLFMLIAAYFVPGSVDRKGPARFIKDRLVRLGIPLAIYGWFIRPALIYIGQSSGGEITAPFFSWYPVQYFKEYPIIGGGPLWFISALLIFSIAYALIRMLLGNRSSKPAAESSVPGNAKIALLALGIALIAYIVRLWSPSDKVFSPLGFQFADFPQYIVLFIVGTQAYRHNWLNRLSSKTGKLWMIVGIVCILMWPPMMMLLGAAENPTPFLGGLNWQSALAATWQSVLGVSMCITVIYLFKTYFNRQGSLSRFLSKNAYTAYLSHEAVITFAAVAFAGVMIYPLLKFGVMALVCIPLIFGLSALIRKLPYTDRVL